MGSLVKAFYQNVQNTPEKKAIWCDGKSFTYEEFGRYVSQLAIYFTEHSVRKGDLIGVQMENSIDCVAIMLAAAELGACILPVNSTLPSGEAVKTFRAMHVNHIVARHSFFEQAAGYVSEIVGCMLCTDGSSEPAENILAVRAIQPGNREKYPVTGHETYALVLTSGMKVAKYVELSQETKLRRIQRNAELFDICADDVILISTPLYHSLAFRMVLMSLTVGGTAILMSRFSPNRWLDCVEEQKVTITIAVSTQLAQLAQLLSSAFVPDLSSMRCVVSSSSRLEPHVRNAWMRMTKCEVCEIYGTSECSTVTAIHFRSEADKVGSVGRPIPGAEVRIVRDDGTEARPNEAGHLRVKTDLLFDGYYGQFEMTRNAMDEDGYFRTGDIGSKDSDGYIYYLGRKDELLKIGGINVYPKEIEDCISEMEGVKECVAFLYHDDWKAELPAVAIVKTKQSALTEEIVKRYCEEHLSDLHRPQKVFFVAELVKNSVGKVERRILADEIRMQKQECTI